MGAPLYLAKFIERLLGIWRAIAGIFVLERVLRTVLEGRLATTGVIHTFGHNAAMGAIGKKGIDLQERNWNWRIECWFSYLSDAPEDHIGVGMVMQNFALSSPAFR